MPRKARTDCAMSFRLAGCDTEGQASRGETTKDLSHPIVQPVLPVPQRDVTLPIQRYGTCQRAFVGCLHQFRKRGAQAGADVLLKIRFGMGRMTESGQGMVDGASDSLSRVGNRAIKIEPLACKRAPPRRVEP